MSGVAFDRRGLLGAAAAFMIMTTSATKPPSPPPRIRRYSAKLDLIVDADAPIETIATGIKWAEGPAWVPDGNYLLFSDPPANLMRSWSRSGGSAIFLSPSGRGGTDPKLVREPGSNGLAIDRAGDLIIADSGSRALTRLHLGTKDKSVLVDRYRGKRFNSPNDLHIARSGAIYFTDPPYGLTDGDRSPLKELPHNGVYRWMPGGRTVLIDGSLIRPNGVALSPDERRLYVSVSDEKAPRIMVYDLDPHGIPIGRRVFLDAAPLVKSGPGLPDGMKVAANGTLFCSAPGGMMILTPDAEPLGLIESGKAIANCAFGEDGRTLFLTASDTVLRLRLNFDALRT